MRALLLLTTAALLCLPGHAARAATPSPSYGSLFNAVWSITNRNFYDPYFLGHDWKAIGKRFRAKLGTVHSDREFAVLANAMLDQLGASHLYLVPPSNSMASRVGIGVRFRDLDGEHLVSFIDPLSDARVKGVRIGDRLLSSPEELPGSVGTIANVQLQSCDGAIHTVQVRRESPFWPPEHPGLSWHMVRTRRKRTIGYLNITRFDDGAAPLIDQAMAEMKDTDGLIIDVRQNSGGNLSSARLASYFSGPAQIIVALFSRPYLAKLGHPVTASDVENAPKISAAYTDARIFEAVSRGGGGATFMTQDLRQKEYTKSVVVLIGRNTGSAGEGFAWMMKRLTHATLVGQKTAGVLLSGKEFELPGGWTLVVPVDGLWSRDGTDYRDRPASPGIAVHWTRADMCSGRDPDIEKALELLGGHGS